MGETNTIILNNVEVRTKATPQGEYLSLTDLAKVVGDKTGRTIINWLSLISTIEYLKEWENRFNPSFNVLGFQYIRMNAGTVRFSLSVQKWVNETRAIGIISDAGRYGGTFAHNAIALEFCAAISPAFKLGVYLDYLELKEQNARKWLGQYEFFLSKIEEDTLEANRFSRDLLADARLLGREKKK